MSNPKSPWDSSCVQAMLEPTISPEFFSKGYINSIQAEAELRFIVPPVNAAPHRTIIAARNFTALATVNVTNYDDYAWTDAQSLQAIRNADSRAVIGSIETTHALIRARSGNLPFIFISAITDRLGHFNVEVSSRNYAQNFACAHNAGVVLSWLLPQIVAFLSGT